MDKKFITLSMLAAAASFVCSQSARAQVTPDNSDVNEYNRQYRSNYEVSLGDQYTGRSPYMRPAGNVPPPPPPAPRPPAPPRAPKPPGCSEIATDLIRMTKRMPAE